MSIRKDAANRQPLPEDDRNTASNSSVPNPAENVNKIFSLRIVEPVSPQNDKWKRSATFDEVKAVHPTLYALDAEENDVRNPTQIKGTVSTYRKIYESLKVEGFNGTILDASSGLGYGTQTGRDEYGFSVDDIEPFADKSYSPMYTDYSTLDKTYDVVISNAVLNVLPQDQRDAMVVKIGQMLNDGGRAFINVRGSDVKNASSKVAINEDQMEFFISNTGSYQKGFTKAELKAYLEDALGDGFTVEMKGAFGGVSALVTKKTAGDMADQPPRKKYSVRTEQTETEPGAQGEAQYSLKGDASKQTETEPFKRWFGESKVVNEDGTPKGVYHDPTQIKSATDNIGTFDPENPDIRYSLKSDIMRSRDSAEPYDAKTLADKALSSVGSRYNRRTFEEEVAGILSYISETDDPDTDTAVRTLTETCKAALEKAVTIDAEHAGYVSKAVEYLKSTRIKLTDAQKADAAHSFDGCDKFRKQVFGCVRITNDGLPLDTAWAELNALNPGLFPTDTNESDMPAMLAAAVNAMKTR